KHWTGAEGARAYLCRHRCDRRLPHRNQRDFAHRHLGSEALRRTGRRRSRVGCHRTPHGDFAVITIRKADERGRTRTGWLHSRHSFSFGEYRDSNHMGFGALRAINEDVVAGGGGFPPHAHADIEIVTYVLAGALQHRDSLGNGSTIGPNEIQRMSAGTGIVHSEFNASRAEPCHFLQIWIVPSRRGIAPSYEQKSIAPE